jgi:hypothetical protein
MPGFEETQGAMELTEKTRTFVLGRLRRDGLTPED